MRSIGRSHYSAPTWHCLRGNKAWEDTIDHIKRGGVFEGTEYVGRYLDVRRMPWFHGMDLPRPLIVTVNRCLVNHHSLVASLFKIGAVGSPTCPCGSENQDLDHIV